MGIEEVRMGQVATTDTATHVTSDVQDEKVKVDFKKARTIGTYEENSKKNNFLREYIIGKAGDAIPEGMKIKVSSFAISDETASNYEKAKWNMLVNYPKHWAKNFSTSNLGSIDNWLPEFQKVAELLPKMEMKQEEKDKIMVLENLNDVRTEIYGSRIDDMFQLLSQSEEEVETLLNNPESPLTDEEKQKILDAKKMFDDFYTVKAEYNGKTYNLLDMSEEDYAQLEKDAPEFAKFVKAEQANLKEQVKKFTTMEMEGIQQSDAGYSGRWAAGAMSAFLAYGMYGAYKEAKELKANLKASKPFIEALRGKSTAEVDELGKVLKEMKKGAKIDSKELNAMKQMIISPFKSEAEIATLETNLLQMAKTPEQKAVINRILGKWKAEYPQTKKSIEQANKVLNQGVKVVQKYFDSPKPEVVEHGEKLLSRYLKRCGYEGSEYVVKSAAELKGGLKMWKNPIAAFKAAKGAALASLIWLTVTNCGDDMLGAVKDAFQDTNNFGLQKGLSFAALSSVGAIATTVALVPTTFHHIQYNRAEKLFAKNGLIPQLTKMRKLGRAGFYGLFGMLIASSASGGSWSSMACTAVQMKANGKKLVEKGLIKPEDDTMKSMADNLFSYEAYDGKWDGITTKGDWPIGAVGGATGLFTHTNPYIQGLSYQLQGCSETLTACGYQLTGNVVRNAKLENAKKELLAEIPDKKVVNE